MHLRATGGARPSRAMSLITVVVGLGMLLAAAAFLFGGPIGGISVFFVVWLIALASIVGYHAWNAFSPHGVDHTQFHFDARHSPTTPPAAGAPPSQQPPGSPGPWQSPK